MNLFSSQIKIHHIIVILNTLYEKRIYHKELSFDIRNNNGEAIINKWLRHTLYIKTVFLPLILVNPSTRMDKLNIPDILKVL